MKCEGCDKNFSMDKIRFVEDGMVPNTTMKRHRAYCKDCPVVTIDGKPPEKDKEYPF